MVGNCKRYHGTRRPFVLCCGASRSGVALHFVLLLCSGEEVKERKRNTEEPQIIQIRDISGAKKVCYVGLGGALFFITQRIKEACK